MDAVLYMSDMLSDTGKLLDLTDYYLWALSESMKSAIFKGLPVDKQQAMIMIVRETAPKVGKLVGEFVGHAFRKQSSNSEIHDLVKEPKEYKKKIEYLISGMIDVADNIFHPYFLVNREELFKDIKKFINMFDTKIQSNKVKNIENMLLEEADISNCITLNENKSMALFFKKAFPDLFNMQNDHERRMFCYKFHMELGDLKFTIPTACEEQPLALLLIGGLLSLKPITNNIWKRVNDDLDKIKKIPYRGSPSAQNNGQQHLKPMACENHMWHIIQQHLKPMACENHMWHIIAYCYNDLPYYLQRCFLYFACYPVRFEIPATSLTQIWIAEGFVDEEDKQTSLETTANKYLDELVQRSLVFVSKRSLLGTIKSCRLPHSIHEFAIQQSYMEGFLVVNPDHEDSESRFRLAIHHDNDEQYNTEVKIHHDNEEQYNTEVKIHHDNEEQYNTEVKIHHDNEEQYNTEVKIHHDNEEQYSTEVKNNHICSFLAFNFDRNVLENVILLKVLALRNSAIPVTLSNMIYLRYLGLRDSKISNLPQNIGDLKYLQTLDVRDTSIETIPKSLWNIKTLRHVYVEPSPQTKGPPSATHIDNLQTLKTVDAHESWVENIPHFLIHLRKLALSNWDNLDWKSISNLLSYMDKLISMAIMGKIIPSEFADIRAFPNLETVKSMKLEGEWNCRKLLIDNVKFPPNLTKLTLTNSGLKEDPMPTLERLQVLKFLSLQDGVYKGKKMVCSAKGFPKLQFLELKKMENLENWEVEQGAMEELSKLRVNQCRNHIGNHPNLDHVTDKVIDKVID